MNFLRLPDHLLSVLFEDDDIIAIDKPYGFNAHTNDSKIEHSDFIQDGLIEMFEKQLGKKLCIVHRLDQTTTGVMIFGKSVESAKKYAEYFFNRQVKKTYWFVTKSKSQETSFLIDKQIIHKGRELDAKTHLSLLKSSEAFSLWQANPFTGRNHQIRIHAQHADISILGDSKYDGAEFPFLCLHNHQIEFPNGIVITSQPPVYFENLDLLEDMILARAFFEIDRRSRLFGFAVQEDQCFRLVHCINHAKEPGFTIDQFGKVLVLNWQKERWGDAEVRKFTSLATVVNKPIVIRLAPLKGQKQAGKESIILYPTGRPDEVPSTWIAKESQIAFEFSVDTLQSMNLFSCQRLQRNWLLHNSKNKSVLNLFAYTGGYSLMAALGRARSVTSVDASKNILAGIKRNFEVNNLDPKNYIFLFRDSLAFLEQCQKKQMKYDLVVCDTPSFVRREKGVFKIENDLEFLIKNCLESLNPKGELLISTHYDGFFIDDIRKVILRALGTLDTHEFEINCILPSLDYELPDEKANLKSFLIKLS
jgi:23S rRNA (cytosine1962-C5)-methyltransferase